MEFKTLDQVRATVEATESITRHGPTHVAWYMKSYVQLATELKGETIVDVQFAAGDVDPQAIRLIMASGRVVVLGAASESGYEAATISILD